MPGTNQHHYPLNCPTGRWTMLSTILASSMAFIDGTALNVILPSLQRELDASGLDLFWVLNSYLLMLAALIIVGGSLGDKLGRVKVFKFGILVFTIGSALCGFAPDIRFLIIFRTIQGIGGAFMIPGSLAIISSIFSEKEKGKAIGTWSVVTTIVSISGPVLGGALADIGLWRFIFFINIPLGIFSFFALHYKVPESYKPGTSKIDWPGAILLVLSLAAITFGLLEMPELGYSHWVVITNIIIGIILFVVFLYIETKTKDPMMPLGMFRNSTFSGVNLLSFFLYAALGAMMLFLSLNIIQIQGYSQLQAGLTFLPFSLLMVLLGRKMGSLTDKYGAKRFLIFGPLLTGLGFVWLSMIGITNGPSDYWTTYFPGLMVFALGISITVVPLTTTVMTCVDEGDSGIASGINNSVTRISGTFINALLGALAFYWFSSFILPDIDALQLQETMKIEIMEETIKLGGAKASLSYDIALQEAINAIYQKGFVATYKVVGLFSAFLAFLSAGIALLMVKKKKQAH